jgi:hypothetical protein
MVSFWMDGGDDVDVRSVCLLFYRHDYDHFSFNHFM